MRNEQGKKKKLHSKNQEKAKRKYYGPQKRNEWLRMNGKRGRGRKKATGRISKTLSTIQLETCRFFYSQCPQNVVKNAKSNKDTQEYANATKRGRVLRV